MIDPLPGLTGLVFFLVASQSLALQIISRPRLRRASVLLLAGLLAGFALFNSLSWSAAPKRKLRVAALGWTYDGIGGLRHRPMEMYRKILQPAVKEAARQGAVLLVTPETGFKIGRFLKPKLFGLLKTLAKQNSIFRSVENRHAVVRAASNGISAIISAKGELLARRDHFLEDKGLLITDLPLYGPGGTLFSKAGEWVPLVCLGLVLLAAVWVWRRRRRA